MAGKPALAGDLEFIGLADLFQILGGNNCTGRLQITSKYAPAPGVVYFDGGNPVSATAGSIKDLDAVYSLFGWTEGRFEFFEEPVKVGRTIKNSRMQIVLDALRLLDDGEIKKVGPASFEELAAEQAGEKGAGKGKTLPLIKGPPVDYVFVVSEDGFPDGGRIVKEGGHGRWLWVILEGTVEVTRETADGEVAVARRGEGCFIGAFASLLQKQAVRTASVTAAGEVQLGVLNADVLSGEFAALSPTFRGLLLSLDKRLERVTQTAVEIMTGTPISAQLDGDKKLIIKRGSSKEELFVIKEGSVLAAGNTSKGDIPLMTLEKGDVFGHLPFVDIGHEPGFASIFASADLKAEKLDLDKIQKEYDRLSGTLKNMLSSVGTCISMSTGLACHLKDRK